MKKNMKLRDMILLTTLLITMVTVVIFGYVSRNQFEKMLMERTVDDYQETMNAMQKNVDALFYYMEDFAKYMSLNVTVLDTLEEYQGITKDNEVLKRLTMKEKWDKICNQLVFSTSMVYNLEIYSGKDLIYNYSGNADDKKNIPDEILESALSQRSPVWTDLLTLRKSQSYVKREDYGFAVVKTVSNDGGESVGLIAIFVRESSFADILKSVNENEKSRAYLADENNRVISAVEKSELYGEVADILGLSREEYEQCIKEGIFVKEQIGEEPLLYVVHNIGKDGIKLICETTMAEFGRQQRKFSLYTGILMGIAVVCAFTSAWFVSRRITKPLGTLIGVMEQIRTDEKNIHLRYQESDAGEIGMLGRHFNELMDELDASMQQIYDEQRQRWHNEVRLLQAQIIPHFLYNILGIISSFIKLNMKEEALETIQNLAGFYRLSLSSGKDVITIREEVELTHNYMKLQQLRYIEYIEYSIECEKETEAVWVPKLTIQPLVENVVYHGLKSNGGKCQIRVDIALDNDKEILKISVYDNGAGIKKERLEEIHRSLETGKSVTKSFGILNVNQRLKLMYGEKYHMEIESIEGEYTRFLLYLPVRHKYEDKKDV